MSYEIYCDESRHIEKDLKDRFMVVGGVYLPASERDRIAVSINDLRQKHNCLGEIKWNNVSPAKLQFFLDLVELFFSSPELFFRCIVIDKATLKHEQYNQGSHDIFFYKAYYLLLKKPISYFKKCQTYIAYKDKFSGANSNELIRILKRKFLLQINILDPIIIPAKDSVFIQLADLLIGAVGYQHNDYTSSKAKLEVCNLICSKIAKPSLVFSSPYVKNIKFDIFIPKLK